MNQTIEIVFEPQLFQDIQEPDGYLTGDVACHALWNYFLIALTTQRDIVDDPIYYEGDSAPKHNLFAVVQSIATVYGCSPESMMYFWPNVRAQGMKMQYPELREEFMFKDKPEIRSN